MLYTVCVGSSTYDQDKQDTEIKRVLPCNKSWTFFFIPLWPIEDGEEGGFLAGIGGGGSCTEKGFELGLEACESALRCEGGVVPD